MFLPRSLMKNNCVKVFRLGAVSGSRALPNGTSCFAEHFCSQTDIVRFISVAIVPEEDFLKLRLLLWQNWFVVRVYELVRL